MKLKRFFAFVSGAALIAGTTHAAVIHTGGYSSATAPMLIVAAGAVCAAAATLGTAADQRRFGLTLALWIGMVGAELFGAIMTGERVATDRAAKAAPARDAEFKRAEARERLQRAEAAIEAADDRATATRTRAEVCDKACVAGKASAVASARKERDEARAAFEAVPAPKSESPLAEAIHVAPVTLDLILVGLGATFNVLGAALVAFGAHTPAPRRERPASSSTAVAPVSALSGVSESAKRFAFEGIEVRRGQRMTRTAVLRSYAEFCKAEGLDPSQDIGADLSVLFAHLGLGMDARGRITGARLVSDRDDAPVLTAA